MLVDLFLLANSARKGIRFFEKITKCCDIDNTLVMLMYPHEENIDVYLKKYLFKFMDEKKVHRVILLTNDKNIRNDLSIYFNNINISVLFITRKKTANLLNAYKYCAISDRFMILSIEKLYGRNLKNLKLKSHITEDDLFKYGIFTLKDYS